MDRSELERVDALLEAAHRNIRRLPDVAGDELFERIDIAWSLVEKAREHLATALKGS